MGEIIQLTLNVSSETLEARWKWNSVFQLLKEKDRILHPVKIAFRKESKVRCSQVEEN